MVICSARIKARRVATTAGIQADVARSTTATKDERSYKAVCYFIDGSMKASLAMTALTYAIDSRPHASTVVRSDRGSQFRSRVFVQTLGDNRMKGSVGSAGACADKCAMKSFFAVLQTNILERHG